MPLITHTRDQGQFNKEADQRESNLVKGAARYGKSTTKQYEWQV